ncbi:MATE family efflux transporter [Glaciecola sp. MH2013]|uniref:MATE family efflux transporter n=1 Tax=Glaciecola sp. MH2013 TaxID=2785524 RepID=UPI00189D1788|nr:MATE family efflux transporter [Glaciecola sp. MH2013]MBF7074417.1 MATE family efflux transporter [Glaciecola sp. MH2013]
MQAKLTNNATQDSPFKLLLLAFPLILANITTPLLGLVDTAILGHMEHSYYLAGASIATLILTQLYWICGFLKMSVTGLSAQSKSQSSEQQLKLLVQALAIGLVIGVLFVLLQKPILQAGLFFVQSADNSSGFAQSTREYFTVRVWGAPAALANLALVGWLIGQQKTKQILGLQVAVNVINIVLSMLFVFVFHWGIKGVAAATLVAEYSLLALSLLTAKQILDKNTDTQHEHNNTLTALMRGIQEWLTLRALLPLLNLNTHILFRNLALQFTLAFLTFTGAGFGAQTAATNAILMQFFALIALGLDGVANATEALVGEHKGAKAHKKLIRELKFGLLWSSTFALLYSLTFWLFGEGIINILTDQQALRDSAISYLGLMILLPVIAHWCFLMDGVFVGLTQGRAMRDSMIISAIFGFFAVWWFIADMENVGLWLALLSFLACRGIILGLWFVILLRRRAIIND